MGISFDFLNCTKMEQQTPPLISYSNSYPIPNISISIYMGVLLLFFFSSFGDGTVVCTVQCMCCGKRESAKKKKIIDIPPCTFHVIVIL